MDGEATEGGEGASDNGLTAEQNNFCGSLFTNRPVDLDLFIGVLRYVLSLLPMAKLTYTSSFELDWI